jgi:hypothetical protein
LAVGSRHRLLPGGGIRHLIDIPTQAWYYPAAIQ